MKKITPPPPSTYSGVFSLFERIEGILESGLRRVLRTINHETFLAYWLIGRETVQALHVGEARTEYGNAFADLSKGFNERNCAGFSADNTKNFRPFFLTYSDKVFPIGSPSGSGLPSGFSLNLSGSQWNREV